MHADTSSEKAIDSTSDYCIAIDLKLNVAKTKIVIFQEAKLKM